MNGDSVPLRRGIFLDRDGVINVDRRYVGTIKDFEFLPGIFELCSWAQAKNFYIVIVTNQSGIGRGLFSIEQYHELTNWMLNQFSFNNCKIDLIVTSPIDPNDDSHSATLKFRRKPNPGMIFDACEILGIDPLRSVLIGDSDTDMECAVAAGIPTRIRLNAQEVSVTGNFHFKDLQELLKSIELVIR